MSTEISPAVQAMLSKSSIIKTEDLETGMGGTPRISLKKSKFTLKSGDDEIKKGDELDVIIVGISPHGGFSKSLYLNGYTPGSSDAPDCQSSDGIRPDVYVDKPINNVCATCEKSQWGSAVSMSGKKAKACKDSKRLYVILAEDLEQESPTIYLLTVTVLSLKPFSEYGKVLARDGVPSPTIVITRLSFDEEASVPKLEFKSLGVLSDELVGIAIDQAEKKSWEFVQVNSSRQLDAPKDSSPSKDHVDQGVPTATKEDIDGAIDNW